MATICPTVTASDAHEYRNQLECVASFADRIHIDLTDGVFAPSKLIDLKHLWWPDDKQIDLHLMYESVAPFANDIIKLKPSMVIVHAESAGQYYEVTKIFKKNDIKVGVALLQDTPVDKIKPAIGDIDHVLIFSGDLGYIGGTLNMNLLAKARQLRKLKPTIELGWDGGINTHNAAKLVLGGIDVLNVGGAIQRANSPREVYAKLKAISEVKK